MLTNVLPSVAGAVPFVVVALSGCVSGAGPDHFPHQLSYVEGAQESRREEAQSLPALVKVEKIADEAGITGGHGSIHTYIDGNPQDGYLIVHQTFASRTKYKAITPIIEIEGDGLIIDCSYVRSVDEVDGVAVGKYCRGPRAASADALEEAISDEHTLLYRQAATWLNLVDVRDCADPSGLRYANLYAVRCEAGNGGETTSGVSVKFFSSEFELLFSVLGYELAPDVKESIPNALTFWGLGDDSHHRIINRPVP